MQIHVARDGKELGAFSLDDVRAGLVSGKFMPTDFGWVDGQADWTRLTSLPGMAPAAPATPELASETEAAKPANSEEKAARPRTTGSRVPQSKTLPGAPASGLAVASLVCGILSLTLVPLAPAIPAIVCGHLARWRIRQSEGALSGDGVALGGLITGYLSLFVFGLVGALIFFVIAGTPLPD